MDEHMQTAGDFLDGRHAESRRRIAALEAELAERTRERDELRYEKRARSAIDPNERLHNLCDGLAESRRESPYDQESWDLADACNRELQAELAAERERREAAEKDAARLREALGALGVIGNGYCFCNADRDPDKPAHEPECRDAIAAIDAVMDD